jgi:hypothetical protein
MEAHIPESSALFAVPGDVVGLADSEFFLHQVG